MAHQLNKLLLYNPDPEEENLRFDNLSHLKRGIFYPEPDHLPRMV
jgi:hypothetical protein